MKKYEAVNNHLLTPRMPVAIRVDGKAFHTYTKGFNYPFSKSLMEAMESAAFDTACNIQGVKAVYVQSDEVTFILTDYERRETQGWFNYEHQKIVSLSAALMTGYFNKYIKEFSKQHLEEGALGNKIAFFDSRAFNVPTDDVTNLLLWRAQDWKRNSLQMYARFFYSHNECRQKNSNDLHEMLYKKGKNWATDLTNREKNGVFIFNYPRSENGDQPQGKTIMYNIFPEYEAINKYMEPLLKPKDES